MQPILSLKKYLGIFIGVSILFSLLGMVTLYFFEINIPSFVSFLIVFVSCSVAVHIFTKDHNRVPNQDEKKALVWRSFALFILWQVIGTILVFYFAGGSDFLGKGIWKEIEYSFIPIVVGMFVIIILSFFAIWISYSFSIKNYQRAFDKNVPKS